MPLKIVDIDTCHSTMSEAAAMTDACHGTVVNARCQTAGRGQRGNHWESEPGKNLTFSVVLRPHDFPAPRQFELSMAVSVAVCRVLRHALPGEDVRIKWPNDIYVGDRKMVGMLIENVIGEGALITRSIAGIGVNVNQTVFRSDAPNPVSMAQLSGHEHELRPILEEICAEIIAETDRALANKNLSDVYHSMLWRNDGKPHRWLDTTTLQLFDGPVIRVDPAGPIVIGTPAGPKQFYFKQIAAVLT